MQHWLPPAALERNAAASAMEAALLGGREWSERFIRRTEGYKPGENDEEFEEGLHVGRCLWLESGEGLLMVYKIVDAGVSSCRRLLLQEVVVARDT